MIRKVIFPLKLKMIFLLTLLLAGALSYYVFMAVGLYKEDKSASVYSSILAVGSGVNHSITQWMGPYMQVMQEMANAGEDTLNQGPAWKLLPEALQVRVFDMGKAADIYRYDRLSRFTHDKNNLNEWSKINLKKMLQDGRVWFFSMFKQEERQTPEAVLVYRTKQTVVMLRLSLNGPMELLSSKGPFKTFFADDDHQILYNGLKVENDFFKSVLQANIGEGLIQDKVTRLQAAGGVHYLASINKVPLVGLTTFTLLDELKAFEAAQVLINQSLFYGMFILSIAILIGVWFSRRLTTPVQTLFQATSNVASGNFNANITIDSHDEMGALSDSFNFMTKEILRYMEEMKEKARLEAEVGVARLVQSTFFPLDDVYDHPLQISGAFRPASECGGDWWGHFNLGRYTVLMVADATGHGVPAALVTATAHATLTIIEKMYREEKRRPEAQVILSTLNQVLLRLQGAIMMTAWVGVFDTQEEVMYYSNASHQPPLIFKSVAANDLVPLMDANSERLGHHHGSIYQEAKITFGVNHFVVIYSDGLTEIMDIEKRAFGLRRLKKSLALTREFDSAQVVKARIMKDVYGFKVPQVPLEDDMTLVIVKRLSSENQSDIAGENEYLKIANHKVISVEDINTPLDMSCPLIILSQLDRHLAISQLLSTWQNINHLIGFNSPFKDLELKHCAKNLACGNIMGIQHHLGELDIHLRLKIQQNGTFKNQVTELINRISFEEYFEGPRSYLELLSDELIQNALKHSPSGVIDYFLATSDKGLAIAVRDEGGILTRQTVLEKIARGFNEQSPENRKDGAGLGLYLAYNVANRMIISTITNVASEIVVIIEPTKRYKKYKERIPSLHFYEVKA